MVSRIGVVSGEDGPLLLADRQAIETWRGSDGDGSDYERIMALPFLTGEFNVTPDRVGVAWEIEGAGSVVAYRDADVVVLQREWADDAVVVDRPPSAEVLGHVVVTSGLVVVIWSPLAWTDVWEPPIAPSTAQLSTPSMLNIGMQISVEPGTCEITANSADDASRCWIVKFVDTSSE